jgi:hypothetical protein
MTVLRYRWLRNALLLAVPVVLAVGLVAAWRMAFNPARLKDRIVALLSDQLESEVTIESLEGSFFPRVRLSGGGLVVRHRGRTDVPPLLTVKHFEIRADIREVMRLPRHVSEVRLQGLDVHIPPLDNDHQNETTEAATDQASALHEVIVDRFEAPDTVLTLIPRKPNKPAKVFTIHHLVMDSVGRGQKIPFIAVLTNPVPQGQIETSGTFGPWNLESPASTAVSGNYTFAHADLDTIDGLAGILSSEGTFEGPINRIHVQGTTETPAFQIDAGGQPVPLTTKFSAVVDGSDGDTRLERVEGHFLETDLTARGAVVQEQGVPGRRIEVDVDIAKGRIEDVLRLAMDSPTPVLRGALHLQARLVIPPEQAKVLDKLNLRGGFGLSQATFANSSVQTKIASLSRHGQGKNQDDPMGDVMSNLTGRFAIDHGSARFSELTFGVPGALVALSGRYGIRSEQLDFHGSLRMKATLSQAVGGGLKSLFLKPFDRFFKKDGAGTVLPIKIVGPRTSPKFGLELFGRNRR